MVHPSSVFRPARVLALMLIASVSPVVCAVTGAQTQTFSDLAETDAYYQAVTSLAAQGIVRGYPDGTFRPRGQITRAEMLALLYRSVDPEEVVRRARLSQRVFPDVDSTAWYAAYVDAAAADGVIQGFPDGTFRPTVPVDAASALKMIVMARGIPKLDDQPGDRWYIAYARTLSQYNALPPWLLSPAELMTRGTTAVVLYRLEQTRDQWQTLVATQPPNVTVIPSPASSAPSFTLPPLVTEGASSSPAPFASDAAPQDPDELKALQALQELLDRLSQELDASVSGQ